MAKKKRAHPPDDSQLLQIGIDGIGQLISQIRCAASIAESNAAAQTPDAYIEITQLLQELHSLVSDGSSASVGELANKTHDLITEGSRIALAFGLNTQLKSSTKLTLAAIENWKPVPKTPDERPTLVLGSHDDTWQTWDRVANEIAHSPERCSELQTRHEIARNITAVLKNLDTLRARLIEKLLGREEDVKSRKRSWTQETLNEAIRDHRLRNDKLFWKLKRRIKKGEPEAIKEAIQLFGRNSIVKLLGVKSPDMVTKSNEWKAIADELGLPRGPAHLRKQVSRKKTIPSASDDDLLRKMRSKLSPEQVEQTLAKLEEGKMSRDDVLEMIEML
ncbi:MAG: hypothetical protein ACK5Q5_03180 [Planctomycetaceae bacterium]